MFQCIYIFNTANYKRWHHYLVRNGDTQELSLEMVIGRAEGTYPRNTRAPSTYSTKNQQLIKGAYPCNANKKTFMEACNCCGGPRAYIHDPAIVPKGKHCTSMKSTLLQRIIWSTMTLWKVYWKKTTRNPKRNTKMKTKKTQLHDSTLVDVLKSTK